MSRQLSLLEYARLREPARSDADHVEQIAADIVRELAEEPPVDLDVVASYRGISRIELASIPMAGCLAPVEREIVMILNRNDSPRRRRLTAFHEIGHSFQPGYHTRRSYRCAPCPEPRTATDPETLSDTAAAALLLPQAHFAPDLRASTFALHDVANLADRYDASLQATLYRFQRYWPEPTLVLTLEPGLRKSELGSADATPRLRVTSVHANGKWPYIPENKSAHDAGVLRRAFEGEFIDTASNLNELGIGADVPVDVSARCLPYVANGRPHRRVLAVMRPRSSRTRGVVSTKMAA